LLLWLSSLYLASSPVSGLKALPCRAQWGVSLARVVIGVAGWAWAVQWLLGWFWGDCWSGGATCWHTGAQGTGKDATSGAGDWILGKAVGCMGESRGGIAWSVSLVGSSWRSRSLFFMATLRDLSRSLFLAATLTLDWCCPPLRFKQINHAYLHEEKRKNK